jgi:transcriptional regulator with XRE-family HTH domain
MNRLKSLREERGLTKSELARITGIHQATISKYELNQNQIGEENIVRLVKALDTNADYFLGLSNKEKK